MLPTVSASFLSSLCVFRVRGVWVTSVLFLPKPVIVTNSGQSRARSPPTPPTPRSLSFYNHKTDVSRQ